MHLSSAILVAILVPKRESSDRRYGNPGGSRFGNNVAYRPVAAPNFSISKLIWILALPS